ncbi:MAG: hypothetical protein L6R38_003182 [Xanthoria sp. 2 TBL-2021]|nr:MAG: hypothetical protein L6R38_003182 [Xanthoria sp. 2 TBL-2021]
MVPRRSLARLCRSEEITRNQSDTVFALLKDVAGHRFSHLSTAIFHHADQEGRDAILRALSNSATSLELDKVFCSLDDGDVTDIFGTLAVIKHEEKKKDADGDIQRAQDAVFPPCSIPSLGEDYSPTPDPAEMRIDKWISDQNTLLSEHDKSSEHVNNRKRHHSEIASDEHDSSHIDDALPEVGPQERVGIRRQPDRSCKSKGVTQSAMRDGKRGLRTRKIAPPENNRRSKRGISKPTGHAECVLTKNQQLLKIRRKSI